MRVPTAVTRVPLVRHLLVATAGFLLVVLMLETASDYRVTQLTDVATLAIAAGGLTVLTGMSGQLSLGHGAFMAIGAYTAALFLEDPEPSIPLPLVLVAAVLVALAVGAVVGVAAARLHGPYVAGATLALAVAVPGLTHTWHWLGGEQGLTVRVPPVPTWLLDAVFFVTGNPMDQRLFLAYLSWACLIVTFLLLANLMRSRVGRRWQAVRDDDVAAELAGIRLGRDRVLAFVVSTACAGLGGALMALMLRLTAPGSFGLKLSLTIVSVIVLGGLGSLTGALLGAFLLTFVEDVARDAATGAGLDQTQAAEVAPVVYGLTLVLVVIFAPAGLVGSLRNAWLRRKARATPTDDTTPAAALP